MRERGVCHSQAEAVESPYETLSFSHLLPAGALLDNRLWILNMSEEKINLYYVKTDVWYLYVIAA